MPKADAFVRITGDFPDDGGFDRRGRYIPRGWTMASVIRDALKRHGYRVLPVRRHSFLGWRFTVPLANDHGRAELTLIEDEPWLLVIRRRVPWWRWPWEWFGKTPDVMSRFVSKLHSLLHQDMRFEYIRLIIPGSRPKRRPQRRRRPPAKMPSWI